MGENLATTGYVDPMSMTEDQLGVVSELAHTLAETPFTSAGGRCVELIPGFYLSNGRYEGVPQVLACRFVGVATFALVQRLQRCGRMT